MPFHVRVTETAKTQIAQIKARGEAKPDGPNGVAWRAVQHMVKEFLSVPSLCLDPRNMLGNQDGINLTGIFRSYQGRSRFLYIGKRDHWVTLLFIGMRKDGDKRDAYRELVWYLRRADWDDAFGELGLKKPNV